MCEEAVSKISWVLMYVPDRYMTQAMCNSAVVKNQNLQLLRYVPDQYKTVEMCRNAVFNDIILIRFIPDWIISHIGESVLRHIKDVRDVIDDEEGVEEVERIVWKNIHKNKF